jgi:hypothetical protein
MVIHLLKLRIILKVIHHASKLLTFKLFRNLTFLMYLKITIPSYRSKILIQSIFNKTNNFSLNNNSNSLIIKILSSLHWLRIRRKNSQVRAMQKRGLLQQHALMHLIMISAIFSRVLIFLVKLICRNLEPKKLAMNNNKLRKMRKLIQFKINITLFLIQLQLI